MSFFLFLKDVFLFVIFAYKKITAIVKTKYSFKEASGFADITTGFSVKRCTHHR